jgi:putative transposase
MPRTLVKRAYRYRFYPTEGQATQLSRTFGCVRMVYNRALETRATAWQQEHRLVTYTDTSVLLTRWKATEEFGFLNEVSCVPLQQCLRHQQTAFTNFFAKRARFPRFKSRKRGKASAEYTRSAFRWRDGQLTLAKMTQPLDIRWSRLFPEDAQPSTVTVSRDAAGRWHVSILIETSIEQLPASQGAVGIDVGLTSLVTLSTGEKVANPRHEKRDRVRLACAQRVFAGKQKGSLNRAKARLRVARVHDRIADRRRDLLHQLSTRLVRENQTIVVEGLVVANMLHNRSLARAISDAAWSQLRSMLEYKALWYGRRVIVVDRWLPSSKTCSACGLVKDAMPLHIRTFECARCGLVLGRDHNAALNILAAGRAVAACGDGIRPIRR